MPRLLAAKAYPALVDVYTESETQDPITGGINHGWDYENPVTFGCNFFSLRGHAEKFGDEYANTDAVKLEVCPSDGALINLSQRFGHLRMRLDETETYYENVGMRPAGGRRYVFNIDAMSPQVDPLGRVVCVEVFGVLAQVA
ncbi:hypothetical protein [Aeromicrobium sp. Root472D3]|uniref:hypothetical protein n=1 Tax=Aeromicrobium sp. Root472D3 TaxID=1736540 RepID=UPI000700C008|nr:hypothetical protein [Aeromicrobium sp. Root472D3]KQX75400.1 hypothetical protein ASD10_09580 [Aeromicrobium sp. Root472D3]